MGNKTIELNDLQLMQNMNMDLARQKMVEQQVRVWDVSDPAVLTALREVEREQFVPPGFADVAYADTEIALAHGQFMLRPIIEGRLLQALSLGDSDRVLDIGTGSGYLAACLGKLCGEVVSIDLYPDFIDAAKHHLDESGADNVQLHCMDATTALPGGEFDAIAVTASLPVVDERLIGALRDGGRLFVVVGEPPAMTAQLITRSGADNDRQNLFETNISRLINSGRIEVFSF